MRNRLDGFNSRYATKRKKSVNLKQRKQKAQNED